MKRKIIILVVIILLFCIFISIFTAIKKIDGFVCTRTGSRKAIITWFQIFSLERINKSPIQNFLENRGGGVKHEWIRVSTYEYRFLGETRGSRPPPAIYNFPFDWQTAYITSTSDDDVLAFCLLLKSKNENYILDKIHNIIQSLSENLSSIQRDSSGEKKEYGVEDPRVGVHRVPDEEKH